MSRQTRLELARPDDATQLRSEGTAARRGSPGPVVEVELDLGVPVPPRQVAHGPAAASVPHVVVLEAVEHLLVDMEPPGHFFLRARSHGAVDHAARPRILERGRHLDAGEAEALPKSGASVQGRHLSAEGVEALREPHRPQPGAGEAVRVMALESPLRH